MSDSNFKPGDFVSHFEWKYPKMLVVKILGDGSVGCRYRSINENANKTSEYIFHYHEFQPFELVLKDSEKSGNLGVFPI